MASHQLPRVSLWAPVCWKVSEHVACHHNLRPRQRSYNWPTGYQKKRWLVAVFWRFFFHPNRSSSSYSNLVDFTHRHEITGPRGSDRHKELAFIEATAGPSKTQTTCPPECWCVAPARCLGRHHRLLRLSVIKRKDHKRSTSKEFARFEFHIMHLATTRNFQRDWLSTDIHQLRPFRSSTSLTGYT